jgi:Ca-activated chloride channel family protein
MMVVAVAAASIEPLQPGFLAALALIPLALALSFRTLRTLSVAHRTAAVALRCVLLAAIALALADPEWVRRTSDQTVIFALDRSDSVPDGLKRAAEQFVRSAVEQMRPGRDRVGVVAFDGRAWVEQIPTGSLIIDRLGAPVEPHHTNLSATIRLALALLPGDSAGRVVLISDGNENTGSIMEELRACVAAGVPVDAVPLEYHHGNEILVEQLSAPATGRRGEVIGLRLVVRSQVPTSARLILYHNDRPVRLGHDPGSGGILQLQAGPNRLTIPVELTATGVHRFRAVVQPDSPDTDTLPQNNEGRALTIVEEAERVLVVSESAGASSEADERARELIAEALRSTGVDCREITVDDLPTDAAGLADCAAVILSNVSALSLGRRQQQMLASYVRDQGGGLIVIGGDRAFSVGGYAQTPLEAVLPVETSRDRLRLMSLGMVLVIDRSGSMFGEKLAMARQAAIAAVRMLDRQDQVGVIAFDVRPEWVVPMQSAASRAAITQEVANIGVGGGTNLYPALKAAYDALVGLDTNLKHIIALTDGISVPGDFEGIANDCRAANITISTVAVGQEADRELLAQIAHLAGGRMYIADTAEHLPQIFARETVVASRSGIYERPFAPTLQAIADRQILAGFSPQDIPPLQGYVITASKPTARTELVRATPDGPDPILAHWQVGLGRTVAFTSGLWPKWGPQWVDWPGFAKVWTQAVRYVARIGNPSRLEAEASVRGSQARVLVSAEHLPPAQQESLTLSAQLIRPDFSVEPLTVHRTAAGRFEIPFEADQPGTYLVNIPYRCGRDNAAGVIQTGVATAYSPEYRDLQSNGELLNEITRQTGGRILMLDAASRVFERSAIRPARLRRPLWEDLLRLALILFLLDVAIRRIAISPADAIEALRRLLRELGRRHAAPKAAETLATLRDVKSRVRQEAAESTSPAAPALEKAASTTGSVDRALAQALSGAAENKPVVAPPMGSKPAATSSETDYMDRLLRAKRRASVPPHDLQGRPTTSEQEQR